MTQQILSYFQIGVAVLLGTAILLQQKGQGLSGAFGGEGGFYRTKRGLEKTLLIVTIVLAALFLGIGIFRITSSLTSSDSAASLQDLPAEAGLPGDTSSLEINAEPVVDGTANTISIPEIELQTEPISPNESQ